MSRLPPIALLLLALAMAGSACGPRRLTLPTGAGTAAPDFAQPLAEASTHCRDVRTLQTELGLSGRVGGQRVRGQVLGGFAPGALRLEATAPFGSPVFILVADGPRGTLLLRDRRVLENAPSADMLSALVGVPLGPDDLLAVLSGCVKASPEPTRGRAYGPDWLAVDLASGGVLFLQRQSSVWRLVAGRYSGLEIDYPRFAVDRPQEIAIRSWPETGSADLSLNVAIRQFDINGDLPRERLVAIAIPPGTSPITLDELRRLGLSGATGER